MDGPIRSTGKLTARERTSTIFINDLGHYDGPSEDRSSLPGRRRVGAVGPPPDIYGRDTEIRQMQDILDSVIADGVGGFVVLAGDSGVGKTVLVEQLLYRASETCFIARATCESFSSGMSFFPIQEIMRRVSEPDSVEGLISRVFGVGSAEELVAHRAFLDEGEPTTRREYLMATFANVAVARARAVGGGVVIFVDDLERVDPASVDALTILVSRLSEAPIMLVTAARSDVVAADAAHPALGLLERVRRGRANQRLISLRPLAEEHMRRLLGLMLDGPFDLPAGFLARLYAETDGNPLFVREVVRSLRESQHGDTRPALHMVDGRWVLDPSAVLWEIPGSIEDAVATRLRPLTEQQAMLVESAAVIGRRFRFETLETVGEVDEDALFDELEALERLDVIREVASTEGLFEFSNGKIRDVAYARLTGMRKRRLHRRVAEVLFAQRDLFDRAQWEVLVGEHLYAARRFEDAAPHLIAAADDALSVMATHDAAARYRRAIECLEKAEHMDAERVSEIRLQLGEALKLSGLLIPAQQELEKVRQSLGSPRAARWALNHLGDIARMREDSTGSLRLYAECEAAAVAADDTELLAENAADLAETNMREAERLAGGDPEVAAAHAEQYVHYLELEARLAEESGSSQARARAFRNLAKRERTHGDPDAAIKLYERSLKHMPAGISSHQFLIPYAKALRLVGRSTDAFRVVANVLEWSRQIGATRSEAIARQYLGLLLLEAELSKPAPEFAPAREEMTVALDLHREVGFGQGVRETALDLFELELHCDHLTPAVSALRSTDAFRLADDQADLNAVASDAIAQLRANGEIARADRVRELLGELPEGLLPYSTEEPIT